LLWGGGHTDSKDDITSLLLFFQNKESWPKTPPKIAGVHFLHEKENEFDSLPFIFMFSLEMNLTCK
jgi:hypothetical protein